VQVKGIDGGTRTKSERGKGKGWGSGGPGGTPLDGVGVWGNERMGVQGPKEVGQAARWEKGTGQPSQKLDDGRPGSP